MPKHANNWAELLYADLKQNKIITKTSNTWSVTLSQQIFFHAIWQAIIFDLYGHFLHCEKMLPQKFMECKENASIFDGLKSTLSSESWIPDPTFEGLSVL